MGFLQSRVTCIHSEPNTDVFLIIDFWGMRVSSLNRFGGWALFVSRKETLLGLKQQTHGVAENLRRSPLSLCLQWQPSVVTRCDHPKHEEFEGEVKAGWPWCVFLKNCRKGRGPGGGGEENKRGSVFTYLQKKNMSQTWNRKAFDLSRM